MALGSTQLLTEMSPRNILGSKGRPGHNADNLTAICDTIVKIMWEPQHLTVLWAFKACYRDIFTFILQVNFKWQSATTEWNLFAWVYCHSDYYINVSSASDRFLYRPILYTKCM
jgi:hypothetical protein